MGFDRTKRTIAAAALCCCVLFGSPHAARASSDEDKPRYDARVEQYEPDVESKSWSTGTVWMLVFVLVGGSVFGLFKDAKRSHLD